MGYSSKDTMFQQGDGGTPEAFTTTAAVTSAGGPNVSNDAIETTDLLDSSKQYIAGVPDGGEISLELNWAPDAATHDALADRALAASADNYQICYPPLSATAVEIDSVNTTSEVITTTTAHGLTTGQPIEFSSTGTLPDPLAADVTYYAEYVSADTFKVYTTNALAIAGAVPVNLTDSGSGTHSVTRGVKYSFEAIVTNVSPSAPVGDKLTASTTLKVTGSVTQN